MTGGWNRTPWARYLLVTLDVQKNWYPPTEAKLAGSLLMWYGISDNNPIFYYDTPNLCPSLFPWTPPTQSVQQPEGSYLYQILWLCHIPTLRYQWGKIAITLADNHLKAKHKFICDIYIAKQNCTITEAYKNGLLFQSSIYLLFIYTRPKSPSPRNQSVVLDIAGSHYNGNGCGCGWGVQCYSENLVNALVVSSLPRSPSCSVIDATNTCKLFAKRQ